MAGVVRRDGLREAVTKLRDEWRGSLDLLAMSDDKSPAPQRMVDQLSRVLDAVPDVPPAEDDWREANRYYEDDPGLLPDVPPAPPAADLADLRVRLRDAIGDEFSRWLFDDTITRPDGDLDRASAAVIDVLRESGVLVDAADVRARARTETLRELADFFMTRDGPGYVVEEICRRIEGDRAVSEREGTS